MHTSGPPVVLGRSRDQLRNDVADCRSMAGILHHLEKMLSCLYHVVQYAFLETDVNVQCRKSKFVLMAFRRTDVIVLLRNHRAKNLDSEGFGFLSKTTFDLAQCSDRANRP